MCMNVSPCECVLKFTYLFINIEGSAQVESNAFLCSLNEMRTHGKDFLGPIKGVHMWFESNAYSWKACVDLFCGGQGRDIVSFE